MIRTFERSPERRQAGEHAALLESFRKLCETTLDHPGLARPLAFGAEGNVPYLVYSELAGTAMDGVMRRDGVRPVAEVLQRARQLADAIDVAASAGIHHGMMAPCDVILEGERTGVTGFGLAQALIKVGIAAEAAAPYGSPQRLAGAPPTHADDIYSLAAITLELLIATPPDPDQEREAQGLPARRHVSRPAPHETRMFTTIAGVDAGKLRASFAAAFSEEPGERPPTAAAFVASLQNAISNRRVTDEPALSVVAVPVVSDERQDPPPAPVSEAKGADDASPQVPSGHERIAAEGQLDSARGGRGARRRRGRRRRGRPATSRPREGAIETPLARAEPVDDIALVAEVTPSRAPAIDEANGNPVQSWSRPLLVAGIFAVSVASFATGFGGGFIFGQRSVAEPQPTRAAIEEPKPIASTAQAVTPVTTPVSNEEASRPESVAATVARQPAVPAVESGRPAVRSKPRPPAVPSHAAPAANSPGSLLVISRPSQAQVFVDDDLIGTTPFLLSNVPAGERHLRIELPGYKIWTTSVQIEPGARFRVSASLEP